MRIALHKIIICIGVALMLLPINASAFETSFKGRVQSTYVIRDIDGFQYGILDDTEAVQLRNEFKFDLLVEPSYKQGRPKVRMEKLYISYRGAYDAIFDLTDRYDNIREKSPRDYEYGRDDLKLENDLREVFVDFRAELGKHLTDLRIGRQIVQWGESDGFNLMNIVNPQDNRFLMFFADVEDLADPVYMAKLEHTLLQVGPFQSVGLQLLVIPDIRPNQYAPLDGVFDAPYAFPFKAFAGMGPIEEDIADSSLDNSEFGARLGFAFGMSTAYLYYFKGYQDAGVLDWTDFMAGTGNLVFRHPEIKTYGFSFNTFITPIDAVLRGEASFTEGQYFTNLADLGVSGKGYTDHDYYQALIGIDRDMTEIHVPGTDSVLGASAQIYYAHVDDWDQNTSGTATPEDSWRYTALLYTDFIHGSLKPSVFVMYDPRGTWMTSVACSYSPDGQWYGKISQISFYGPNDALSPFSAMVGTSELSLQFGYRW